MQFSLRNIVRAITPPIVLSALSVLLRTTKETSNSKEEEGEKDQEWYNWSFDKYDHWKKHYTSSEYYFLWIVIADRILRAKIESILEIGCGSGQLACLLRDRGMSEYHGLDFSSKRIEHAKKICPEFDFSNEDAFKTDLVKSFSYSAVICTEFLEHIEKDIFLLKSIKSGTKFYGTVPNFPYTSHVRHFANENEVYTRYKDCFQNLLVDSFLANEHGKQFFLIEGTII